MITNHKIEKDILYIYFDFSYEFSKLGYDYERILKHYYTGITIKKLP